MAMMRMKLVQNTFFLAFEPYGGEWYYIRQEKEFGWNRAVESFGHCSAKCTGERAYVFPTFLKIFSIFYRLDPGTTRGWF